MTNQPKSPYGFEEDESSYLVPYDKDRGTDVDSFYRKMDKLDSLIQKTLGFAKLIPDMGEKFERIGLRLTELATQFSNVAARVSKMEVKVDRGHECKNRENIRDSAKKMEQLFLSVVELRERAASSTEDARELSNKIGALESSRRQATFALLGSLFAILSTIGSLIWFLSALSRDVRHESEMRQRQITEIVERFESKNVTR